MSPIVTRSDATKHPRVWMVGVGYDRNRIIQPETEPEWLSRFWVSMDKIGCMKFVLYKAESQPDVIRM
jgi:hypothetical protein